MALRVKKVPEYEPLHGFPGNLFLPVSELKVPLAPLAVPTCLSIGPSSGPWSHQDETLQFGVEAFMLNNDEEESEVRAIPQAQPEVWGLSSCYSASLPRAILGRAGGQPRKGCWISR